VDTSSPSVALIRLLREITRLGKALDKVTYRKQCHFDQGQEETWSGGETDSSLCTFFCCNAHHYLIYRFGQA